MACSFWTSSTRVANCIFLRQTKTAKRNWSKLVLSSQKLRPTYKRSHPIVANLGTQEIMIYGWLGELLSRSGGCISSPGRADFRGCLHQFDQNPIFSRITESRISSPHDFVGNPHSVQSDADSWSICDCFWH